MATQTAVVSKSATNAEALARARTGISLANYPTIYRGFTEKGVPECEIRPRENVFTYRAWRELGRQSVAANTASRSSRSSNARRKTKRLERSRKPIAVPGRRRCFTFHRQTRFRGVRSEHPFIRVPSVPRGEVPTNSHRGFHRFGAPQESADGVLQTARVWRVALRRAIWPRKIHDGTRGRR